MIISARDNGNNRWRRNKKKQNKNKNKDRKEQSGSASYIETVRAKSFCCAFKLGFI